jgi:alkaline phosphatase D
MLDFDTICCVYLKKLTAFRNMIRFYLLILLLNCLQLFAQTPGDSKIISGPMLGYAEHREVLIWVQVSCAKTVTLVYTPLNVYVRGGRITRHILDPNCSNGSVVKFIPQNLEPGCVYKYYLLIDDKPIALARDLFFKTKALWEWRGPAPDFSFIVASCNYVNDSAYDRPGKPYGQGTDIFLRMAEKPTDFMLWLGDNVYLREADYSSESGIKYRYAHTRADKNLQPLLGSRNHYAIWDDHDFGDNNSGKGFGLKETSRKCFTDYWGNKQYGENDEGVYSAFSYADADFILLDNRWWRDESDLDETLHPNKTQLGLKQIEWLFYQLSHSRSTFKFICVGGQFLNDNTDKESFNQYKAERKKVLDYIVQNKISGVIFLTGDRHHTELLSYNKSENDLGYALLELTSSAISSRPGNIKETNEANNPMRISGTLVAENNYCVLKIGGERKNRFVQFSCFDKKNGLLWEYKIGEEKLKAKIN